MEECDGEGVRVFVGACDGDDVTTDWGRGALPICEEGREGHNIHTLIHSPSHWISEVERPLNQVVDLIDGWEVHQVMHTRCVVPFNH